MTDQEQAEPQFRCCHCRLTLPRAAFSGVKKRTAWCRGCSKTYPPLVEARKRHELRRRGTRKRTTNPQTGKREWVPKSPA